MPAPTNISFATATPIDISAIASGNVVTTQDVHFSGTTYDVYFSITPDFDGVISVWPFGGTVGSGYRPLAFNYLGPAGAPTLVSEGGRNLPVLLPVEAGETYFLEIGTNSGNPNPANLTLTLHQCETENVPAGSFFINDDTAGRPAAFVSAAADNRVLRYVTPFPAGEGGDALIDGTALFSDNDVDDLKLYNGQLEEQATVAVNIGDRPALRAHHPTSSFFAGEPTSPAVVKNVSSAGAILSSTTLTGNNSIDGLAVSNDGSVIYHGRGTSNPVRRWVGGTNGTNLAAAESGYRNGYDLIVLPDDTILATYFHPTTGEFFVRRYTDGGTLQQTYTIAATSSNNTNARIAYSPTAPTSFFAYWHPDDETVRVQQITLADGAVTLTRDNPRFEGGASVGPESDDPELCGVSDSCPLVIWPVAIVEELTVDPSLPCCCDDHAFHRCCSSTRTLAPGSSGSLLPGEEGTSSFLTPDSSEGRLLPSLADPTLPEQWA